MAAAQLSLTNKTMINEGRDVGTSQPAVSLALALMGNLRYSTSGNHVSMRYDENVRGYGRLWVGFEL